ncbi:MAG: ABC transporter ATP-binding protein [Ruminococcaceae bacterium]|nr:ABC transporter ATP-binding protein [Oscillospiraceae bacterium]
MIKATDIHKSFEGAEILKGVSLSVGQGEFLSIMGRSGSGKSTLLNILAGNLRPDAGSVLLEGEDIFGMKEKELARLRRTKLGFVYQTLNLIPTLSAKDNILLPLYLNRERISDKSAELENISELLDIKKLLDKFPHALSGGERQRVAIARSLLHSPRVIMLDEPTGSLDLKNAETVMQLLSKINREMGVSIVQVTHNPDAAKVGDRVILLSDGEVVSQ